MVQDYFRNKLQELFTNGRSKMMDFFKGFKEKAFIEFYKILMRNKTY